MQLDSDVGCAQAGVHLMLKLHLPSSLPYPKTGTGSHLERPHELPSSHVHEQHHFCDMSQAASRGPRATEQFGAVASTLVAGLASQLRTAGITASFLAAAAEALEAARLADDSLACGNLAGLLSHIYLAGLTDCRLIFSLLDDLRAR